MPREQSDSTKAANAALDVLRKQSEDNWKNSQYTKSIIAIIDIMGIKEWFSGEPDFANQMKLYKAWDFIIKSAQLNEVKQDLREKYGDFPLKYTLLSDSLIVSVSIDIPFAFNRLMMYLRMLINSTYVEQTPPFMTRGAIVIGDIFQEGNIIFGPGLIKAHLMESKVAENFRHIIGEEDFATLQEYKDKDTQNMLTGWFNKEGDYYCYDYLRSYLGYVDNRLMLYPDENAGKNGIAVLNKINKKIEDEIKNNSDKRVVRKYKWMRNYFKRTLQWALYRTGSDDYVWLKHAYAEQKGGKP